MKNSMIKYNEKNNFFRNILKKIRTFFFRNKNKELTETNGKRDLAISENNQKDENRARQKDNFRKSIEVIDIDKNEDVNLVILKEKYENNFVGEEDLSTDEIKMLTKYYKEMTKKLAG